MYCPSCSHLNLPGADLCTKCLFDLASIDTPSPQDSIEESLMRETVESLHPRVPVTLPVAATIGDAMECMRDRGVGAVLLTGQDSRLAGIITERDILMKAAGLTHLENRPLRSVMTAFPETVGPQDTLAFAVGKMSVGGYRHMPVVRDGVPVGVFSVRDLLRHVTKLCSAK
jgi:CBS domain-containing protein